VPFVLRPHTRLASLGQCTGVNAKPNSVAVFLAQPGGLQSLAKTGGARLKCLNCVLAVQAPGDNGLAVGFGGQQVVNVAALGQKHEKAL
jgi:hypothetical protein